MSRPITEKGVIVLEYCTKHPDVRTDELGRM